MNNLIKKYNSFITILNPTIKWKLARFLLHWVTLPLKLILISAVTIVMHIYLKCQKKRDIAELQSILTRKLQFKNMFLTLPIYDNGYLKLYVNRVPSNEIPDGRNHNDDHQGARHGTYAFIMSKLGLLDEKINNATRLHLQKQYGVVRGFKYDLAGNIIYNAINTSGDQLLGLCMAVQTSDDSMVKEAYEQAIMGIIDNDYALRSADGKTKSDRAMWQPGLETVGAQSLTILAALSVGIKLGNPEAKKHYRKLIWMYGYGALSLFPTTFIPKQRGYFNDHNCMIASYLLAKNAPTKIGKIYWGLVAFYVWSLSYNWYNPYFTGLLKEIAPKLVSDKYMEKCKQLLFEEEPISYASNGYDEVKPTTGYPVKFNDMNQGELYFDEEHTLALNRSSDSTHSGLGWVASAVMIDNEEAKQSLK